MARNLCAEIEGVVFVTFREPGGEAMDVVGNLTDPIFLKVENRHRVCGLFTKADADLLREYVANRVGAEYVTIWDGV